MEWFKKIFGPKSWFINDLKNKNLSESEILLFKEIENKIDVHFINKQLIITALKHRSYLNVSNEDRVASNERLEFLGDAVLDLVITHYLFEKFPKRTEGQLSKIKSILVSKPVLAESAKLISLGEYILLNKGEEKTGGRKRQSILADSFEALIGAIYLDQGLEVAGTFIKSFVLVNFKSIMQRELYQNHKSTLLEYSQSAYGHPPEYKVVEESGPDHAKEFKVNVYVNGNIMAEGIGKSKKIAEQNAAMSALKALGLNSNENA